MENNSKNKIIFVWSKWFARKSPQLPSGIRAPTPRVDDSRVQGPPIHQEDQQDVTKEPPPVVEQENRETIKYRAAMQEQEQVIQVSSWEAKASRKQ